MYLPQRLPGQEWLGVVVAIPEPWVSALTDIRVGLGDEQGTKVPAHITILPPTAVDKDRREDVIEHLRTVAQRYTPFRVTLGETGSFRPVSPVVYLSLAEGARECTFLAEDIRSGPLYAEARFPYHAHVTLAQGVSDEALDRAMSIGSYEASWMVPGFRLDRVDENGVYSSMALFGFESA